MKKSIHTAGGHSHSPDENSFSYRYTNRKYGVNFFHKTYQEAEKKEDKHPFIEHLIKLAKKEGFEKKK